MLFLLNLWEQDYPSDASESSVYDFLIVLRVIWILRTNKLDPESFSPITF